jgi:hypothetical protein
MGLFSKNADKGWGGKGDRCVITGGKANTTSKTIFGGRVKTSSAATGKGKK